MLVNPELIAWLGRQNITEREKNKAAPLVKKSEKTASADTRKNNDVLWDKKGGAQNQEEVDYLNERQSNLNLYA